MSITNEFQKYWHPPKREWHEYKIGVYHVSSIGCNNQDLDPDQHSGPCLRATYWEYSDPLPNTDETIGNLEEGDDHHKRLQEIIKEWKPNCIIEDPLGVISYRKINGEDMYIKEVGSIDILYKHLFDTKDTHKTKKQNSIWDIKTASNFTLPSGKYDKNPTHFNQTYIYANMLITFELNPKTNMIKRLKIIYINKHNKGTYVQREKYKPTLGKEKYEDFDERCWYLHSCLLSKEIPVAEPMHWCKLCKYLERCLEAGGVKAERTKSGKIKKIERIDDLS